MGNVLFKYSDVKELEKYPVVKGVYDDLMGKEMFPENFSTLESLKLKFLTYLQYELKQYCFDLDLKLEDGKVMMGDKVFVDMDKLQCFTKNEEYQNLVERIGELEELLSATTNEDKMGFCFVVL